MNKQFLFEMLKTQSVSGNEIELQKKIMAYMKDISETFITDNTGNLISVINTDNEYKVMLAGHVDEIGLMVTNITASGMLKVTNVGGIKTALYLGQKVRIVKGNNIYYGTVGVTDALIKNKDLTAEDIFIDLGAKSSDDLIDKVVVGDYIIVDSDYRELLNNLITARALDNRVGAFIVSEALRKANDLGTKIGVYSATTVGEETTMRGAHFAASRINPDFAIVVDVTFSSDYPGVNADKTGNIIVGNGPVLCNSSIVSKKLNNLLIETAKSLNINIQYEAAPGRTGTDGDKIHFVNNGIPVVLISIPLRYMHSTSEVISLDDVNSIIDLIANFLANFDKNIDLNPFI